MTTLRTNLQSRPWLFWGVLLVLAALVVWLGPEEQTLGAGIRSVYIHVALIWVGMGGLAVAGLIGLAVIATANPKTAAWMQNVSWVGALFYAAGVGMSIISSKVNWGNVFWQEPRMRVALNMLALVVVFQVLMAWLPWTQVRGALSALLIAIMLIATYAAPLVLHPDNPIGTSDSAGIRMTFVGLTLLAGVGAVWLVWFFQKSKKVL